jgi:hypothetical protein
MKHLLPTVVVIFIASTIGAQTPAPSWPQWRGPGRDGVASAFTAPATWPAQLTKKWQATVGLGHASPVIVGNQLVVHTRQANREIVAAYDLASGTQLWQDGDTPRRQRPRLHLRRQRHLFRARSHDRQAALAQTRDHSRAGVRHGQLADC